MGTARAPVVGSTSCPACTESVARCCFLASAMCSLLKIIAASERPAVWGRPQAYGKSGLVAFQLFGQWPKLPAQLPAWTRGQQQRGPLARRKVMLHSIRPTRVCWQVAAGFSRSNHPFLRASGEGAEPPLGSADQQTGWHYG